jgi:hypothetical protein
MLVSFVVHASCGPGSLLVSVNQSAFHSSTGMVRHTADKRDRSRGRTFRCWDSAQSLGDALLKGMLDYVSACSHGCQTGSAFGLSNPDGLDAACSKHTSPFAVDDDDGSWRTRRALTITVLASFLVFH